MDIFSQPKKGDIFCLVLKLIPLIPNEKYMLFLFLSLISCDTTEKTDTAQSSSTNISTCDTPLSVVDWSEEGMPVEGIEGIEEELAAIDLSELEDPVDISQLIPLFRGIIAYALEIPPGDLPNDLSHAQTQSAGKLGDVVLASLLLGKEDPTGIDFAFFRRGFHHYYTCSRGFPSTLDGFQDTSKGTYMENVQDICKEYSRNICRNIQEYIRNIHKHI